MLLADRGYDADWIRELAMKKGAWANIPPKSNRSEPICFSRYLYRARNRVERFFNRIKQCRRVATRYDKPAANYLDFVGGVSKPLDLPFDFAKIDRLAISACGTAYLAGLIGKYWFERYARLPVDQNEETREPELTPAAAAIACLMPVAFVMSPEVWNTATSGACSPVPNVLSVRWFVS